MNRDEAVAAVMLIVGIGILLGSVAVYGIVQAKANVECLAYGYPKATVDMYLNAYCIRRFDQTDVVEPLAKIRRERS